MLKKAMSVFRSALRFFKRYPKCIIPLLVVWCIYASITLWIEYSLDFDQFTTGQSWAIVFGIYVLYSFLFGVSCLILLELIQQIERGETPSIFRAFFDTLIRNFWKAFPILLVWAVFWFLLAVLDALLSSKKDDEDDDGKPEFSAKAAVGTMLGADRKFSLSRAFIDALKKGLRMFVFLIMPAIAWEDLGPIAAVKKGTKTLRNTKGHFLAAYGLTEVFFLGVLLPPCLIYTLDDKLSLALPEPFWWFVLIYIACATSLTYLIEQLYVAQLYLWHINWEKDCARLKAQKKIPPKFSASKPPVFFEDFCSLEAIEKDTAQKKHKKKK